ncbi:MAG: apolipoprotein N-acyltransferase [Sphingorhabdus sp.]
MERRHCTTVQKISQFISRHPSWIAIIAGAASASGFAPLNLWPVTLLCFALFIHLVAQATSGRLAAMIGWLFGVGHFAIGNNWIAVAFTFQAAMPAWLGWIAVMVLALYLAIYPALAAWGAWSIAKLTQNPPRHGEGDREAVEGARRSAEMLSERWAPSVSPADCHLPVPGRITTLPLILAFAGCWIITEWLRSWVFTGFAWNPLGVSLVSFAASPAIFVGTYGLSGFFVLASALLLIFAERQWRQGLTYLLILSGLWFGMAWRQAQDSIVIHRDFGVIERSRWLPLTIVQPNISQADKHAPGYEELNFAKLAQHSRPLPDQGPRLLLWPEAAIPDYLEDGYPYRFYQFQPGESAIAARLRLTTLMGPDDILLTGSNRLIIDKDGQLTAARNSMTAMDANANIVGQYDKSHLVPYGEYLPLKWLLTPLGLSRLVPGDIDFLPGPGAQTMTLKLNGKPVKIGLQICYEIIFSGQVVDRQNRPDFLFNPSNDAWFGSWGPPQHLAQARLRAIEEGVPVVRATPTGISAVIDADGRIVESLASGKAGRIDARLPSAKAPTLFARYGNILPVGFALLLIAFALLPLARRRTSR